MRRTNFVSQQLTWQPKPAKKSVAETPYKEGKHLPNSTEEDVGSHQLCPTYNKMQLKRIRRIKNNKKMTNSNTIIKTSKRFKKKSKERITFWEENV